MAKTGRPIGTSIPILERLLNKVLITSDDCWIWQGGRNNIGYGMIRDGKQMRTTHRVSYEEHIGKIPAGMCVLHNCDTPLCVNPAHLRLGTHKDNTRDMIAKSRDNIFGLRSIHARMTCTHCGMTAIKGLIARWHNDNCKHKV